MDQRRTMSLYSGTYGVLEQCLGNILYMIEPLESDRIARSNVINKIATSLQYEQMTKGASIKPFGSFVSNLYTKWGDLDISVNVPTDSGIAMSKSYKRKLLSRIIRTLRNSGTARYIEFVPNARVPLLKFKSSSDGISCDISVDNYLGVLKSKILLWISEIDERFRDMVLLTKEWAKAQQINDPKFGTLNSYSLCLLVIFHFQTCEPAILPPLMEIYQGNLDEIKGNNFTSERHIEDVCTANIRKFKSLTSRKENKNSLGQLLITFFHKFSNIRTLVSDNVICTYTGQWEGRSSIRWSQMSGVMLVDDPFEKSANAARTVGVSGLNLISDAFINTYQKLSSSSVLADQQLLLPILTKHHANSTLRARSQHSNNTRGNQAMSPKNGFPRLMNSVQRQHINHLGSSSRNYSIQGTRSFAQVDGTYDPPVNSNRHYSESSLYSSSARGTPVHTSFAVGNGVHGVQEMDMHNSRPSSRISSRNQETTDVKGQMWRPKFR